MKTISKFIISSGLALIVGSFLYLILKKSRQRKIQSIRKKFEVKQRVLPNDIDQEFRSKFQSQIFKYSDLDKNSISETLNATVLKRLRNEFILLEKNLPCNFSSSFFVRANTEKPQLIDVLISGPRGTPYEHGLYLFRIDIPPNYPFEVPKCLLKTTGKGYIRFNPNLYNCGKVCLSLLGTWPGAASEKWQPTSNILQLLLSISSIIMNDHIIENEPGFENSLKSTIGIEENEGYCNIVRVGNILYAMIDMINFPPKGFEDTVREYFKFKNKELLEDLNLWIERINSVKCRYSGLTNSHNYYWVDFLHHNKYQNFIQAKIDELKALIEAIN